MFTSFALSVLSAFIFVAVRADISPVAPGPGDTFNAGATCHIAWNGDPSAPQWKTTNIELMSGSNLNMNHLTTVTTTPVDGTMDGTYDYPCPAVTPNSPIYFYQFSNPTTSNLTWTTRFAIASASGATTPPANSNQPSGDPIPWGTGALVNPADGTPPPTIGSAVGSSAGSSTGSNTGSNTVSNSTVPTSAPASSSSPPKLTTVASTLPSTPTGTSLNSTQATTPVSNSTTGGAGEANAAMASLIVDARVWQSLVVLSASTLAFTLLL